MGGGGKGVAYLGVIRALEKLGVLPIDVNKPGQNQIKGISGASAGAITALLLALGNKSGDIENLLKQPSTFNSFFDSPQQGKYRSVNSNNKPDEHNDSPTLIQNRKDQIKLLLIASALSSFLENTFFPAAGATDPMVAALLSDAPGYIYNLIYDRGLFPGFKVREFLANQIGLSTAVIKNTLSGLPSSTGVDGGNISFRDLTSNNYTGVDLVITGTNTTKRIPAVFSKEYTPEFPVAEAVGISMSIPLLFKPVFVETDVPITQIIKADDYHGFWVDGGMLNNFPMHVFDNRDPPPCPKVPNLRPLKKDILGLRLTPGNGNQIVQPPDPQGASSPLMGYFSNLFETLLYPSNQGQIRTPDEKDQTIDIYTGELKTTEFAPPDAKIQKVATAAERAVYSYFSL